MPSPKAKPKTPTDPRPTLTRREVEYHQSVARGKAAQTAAARGFERPTVIALAAATRGQPKRLNDHLTLKPLTLQVEVALTEYTHLRNLAAVEVTAQKRLIHYVAFFSDPATSYELMSDPTLTPTERWAEFDQHAFALAEALEDPALVEAATTHILSELRLLDDVTTNTPATEKKKPTPQASRQAALTRTRARRRPPAAPPQAG